MVLLRRLLFAGWSVYYVFTEIDAPNNSWRVSGMSDVRVLLCARHGIWGLLSAWAAEIILLALAFGGVVAALEEGCGSCGLGLGSVGGGETAARGQGGESQSACGGHLQLC